MDWMWQRIILYLLFYTFPSSYHSILEWLAFAKTGFYILPIIWFLLGQLLKFEMQISADSKNYRPRLYLKALWISITIMVIIIFCLPKWNKEHLWSSTCSTIHFKQAWWFLDVCALHHPFTLPCLFIPSLFQSFWWSVKTRKLEHVYRYIEVRHYLFWVRTSCIRLKATMRC